VKQHVKAGMTVLDIGANVGYYSKLFSKLVGDQGQVISFEPHPMTFKVLSENVSPPGNVRAIEAAISDKNGKSEFFDFLVDSGGSSLRFDAERRREQWDRLTDEEIIPKIVNNTTVARYSVTTRTVDSVLQELGVKTVDFIKMDIEGAEIHAISGMGTTLKNSPHLQMVMELNPRSLQSFGLDANAAFAQLKKVGFDHISLIDEKTNFMYLEDPHTLADLERSLLDGLGRVNILCKMGG
jgi:FkbM family methyltransferase